MLEHLYAERTHRFWVFRGHPQGRPLRRLNWTEFVEIGTRSQRDHLKQQSQAFLDAWVLNFARSGGVPSPLSVIQIYYRVRSLARWMAQSEIWSYSELTPTHIEGFIRSLVGGKVEGGIKKPGSLKRVFSIIRDIWSFRADIPHSLRYNPCDVLKSVERRLTLDDDEGWKPLQEQDAFLLLSDAVTWIEKMSADVAFTIDYLYQRRGLVLAKQKHRRTAIFREIYDELAMIEAYQRVKAAVGTDLCVRSLVVRRAYRLTLGAALTVIFGLVGMRSGEVACMARDCAAKVGQDGEEMYHLHSVESKRHRARSWATTQTVHEAVRAIAALFPWVENPHAPLLQVFGGNGPVPFLGRSTRPMPQGTIVALVDDFSRSPHRATLLEDTVHPHRWRHTFARFVMRRDKSALGALAEHFGHVLRWVTDGVYASGRDRALEAMLKDSELADMAAGFERLLTAPVVAGKGAPQLEEMRREVAERTFQGKPSLESMIRVIIGKGVLKLAPCNWGYCIYEQSLSACKGTRGRPDDIRRNPGTCATCANFAVTREHKPFWEERYKADEQFLQRSDIPNQSKEYVQARIEVSANILRRLI